MGNSKDNNFGYLGQQLPTINAASTSGVFNNSDIQYLKSRNEYPGVISVEYLVIAGGAGGHMGGGGAGGYRTNFGAETSGGGNLGGEADFFVDKGTSYTVTVGAGGTAENNGNDSVFSTISSVAGGTGGNANANGQAGGSGGGAGAGAFGTPTGGAGTANQGFAGGNIGNTSHPHSSAGGGGAGEVGENNPGTTTAGDGGNGLASSITGSSVTRAGGGGGAIYYNGSSPGTGGSGGGGNGLNNAFHGGGTAGSGSTNTGSGGGGGSSGAGNAGAGGSGIVVLKYPDTFTLTIGGGLTSSTSTSGGFKITSFTAGTDTISWGS